MLPTLSHLVPRARRALSVAGVATLGALTLAACNNDPISIDAAADGQSLILARFGTSEVAGRSGQASDSASQRAVITDAASWTKLWTSLALDPNAASKVPNVDFATNMVIVAAMPVQPSGGYSIKIEKVTEWANYIEAEVVERSPAPGCPVTMVITRPFDMVQVPLRSKPVKFVERTAVNTCNPSAKLDTVSLPSGRAVDVRGVKVTLLKVENDSRCPMNAVCVWEGDAAVRFRFEAGGQASDVTLHTSAKGGVVSTLVGGVEFQLVGLTPFVVAGQPAPDQSKYTAILAVR